MKEIEIGNGGAGITGFVQYMCATFNKVKGTDYKFTWVTSDTTETINGLLDKSLDIGWPYGQQTVCDAYNAHTDLWTSPTYIFRDHFLLVGPKDNPANLPTSNDDHPHVSNEDVYKMFKLISEGKSGTKFMTRNDASATNILERNIFKHVLGHYPEVGKDDWYVAYKSYPDKALQESNEKGYYTLSDRGIWAWASPDYKTNLRIYCEGGDDNTEDILLNPCFAIARKTCEEAVAFYEWLGNEGQAYVELYKQNNERLYSKAPSKNLHPC